MAKIKINDIDKTVKLTEDDLKHIQGGIGVGELKTALGDGSVKSLKWQEITLKRGYIGSY